MVTIENYKPSFIRDQVDLIWEITDQWKYGYETSYQTVEQAYAKEGFDPESRWYAFEGDRMVGFVGANYTEDQEGKITARMRLPIAVDGDMELITTLMDNMEEYLRSKGVDVIRAPAGVGLGNTIPVAEHLGFERGPEIFKRSYAEIPHMQYSGEIGDVVPYSSEDSEKVREVFKDKMGMEPEQGEGFFEWAMNSVERKNNNNPNSASCQVLKGEGEIVGFSYLMKSDHQPWIANSMPIYVADEIEDTREVMDNLISAHLATVEDIKLYGMYLMPYQYEMEPLYQEFGFEFDPSYIYHKDL